jgi:PAS domain S-box-containing protein
MTPEETSRMIHELQLHQIELEMQNDELRRVQVELNIAKERYFDLYDLAPIGYCTISEQGLFLEANLTASILLGINRGELIGQGIFQFIHQDDQGIYYLHRKQLIEKGERGFAVVANEIKDLAKQTAQATLNIKNQINDVQQTTEASVAEFNQISEVISGVNDIVATIAAAVEEQTAATREIANNIAQASQGIQEVNENVSQSSTVAGDITQDISKVNLAATGISESSKQVQTSSEDLQRMATELNAIVGSFKV